MVPEHRFLGFLDLERVNDKKQIRKQRTDQIQFGSEKKEGFPNPNSNWVKERREGELGFKSTRNRTLNPQSIREEEEQSESLTLTQNPNTRSPIG